MNTTDYASPLNCAYDRKYPDNIPRSELIPLISGAPGRVLDVGCGSGSTGVAIKRRFPQAFYVGIEINREAAKQAEGRLNRVIVGNIETMDFKACGIEPGWFDLILCGDVLEHLYDPWKTLYRLKSILKPDGKLLASIPNVQNLQVILNLLQGQWTYQQSGLLDATHIRFFTGREILKLFAGAGWKIVNCATRLAAPVAPEGWPKDLQFGKLLLRNVTFEEAVALHTFQYFITAEKNDAVRGDK